MPHPTLEEINAALAKALFACFKQATDQYDLLHKKKKSIVELVAMVIDLSGLHSDSIAKDVLVTLAYTSPMCKENPPLRFAVLWVAYKLGSQEALVDMAYLAPLRRLFDLGGEDFQKILLLKGINEGNDSCQRMWDNQQKRLGNYF
jgi:hypothetical protein